MSEDNFLKNIKNEQKLILIGKKIVYVCPPGFVKHHARIVEIRLNQVENTRPIKGLGSLIALCFSDFVEKS